MWLIVLRVIEFVISMAVSGCVQSHVQMKVSYYVIQLMTRIKPIINAPINIMACPKTARVKQLAKI
jgi:hypothetical protein